MNSATTSESSTPLHTLGDFFRVLREIRVACAKTHLFFMYPGSGELVVFQRTAHTFLHVDSIGMLICKHIGIEPQGTNKNDRYEWAEGYIGEMLSEYNYHDIGAAYFGDARPGRQSWIRKNMMRNLNIPAWERLTSDFASW